MLRFTSQSFYEAVILLGHYGQNSQQSYFTQDSNGYCHSEKLTAADDLLASITDGVGCP